MKFLFKILLVLFVIINFCLAGDGVDSKEIRVSASCDNQPKDYSNKRLPYRELIVPANILPSSHSPSIAELPDGSLFAVWYAPRADGLKSVIWSSRKIVGGKSWSIPVILHYTNGYSNKNPVLFSDKDGKLWLFWSDETRFWKFVIDRMRYMVSSDMGNSWSHAQDLAVPSWFLARTHPIVLKSGRIILPVYSDWNTSSAVIMSDDGAKSWRGPSHILFFFGIQPTIIERSDGTLFALMRSGMWPRLSWQAESTNGGFSWHGWKTSNVKNPGCSLEMLKLRSGNVILVFNDSKKDRSSLNMAISRDDGRSWLPSKTIDFIKGSTNIYPSVIQTKDGLIHVLYSYDNRSAIAHFVADEKWISG